MTNDYLTRYPQPTSEMYTTQLLAEADRLERLDPADLDRIDHLRYTFVKRELGARV